MSKRKEKIAMKDQRDFKKFTMTVGIIMVVVILIVYLIFMQVAS